MLSGIDGTVLKGIDSPKSTSYVDQDELRRVMSHIHFT